MTNIADLMIRDPFVLTLKERETYFLYSSSPKECGFDCWKSRDLTHWEGPYPVFRPSKGFPCDTDFWAPEVHRRNGRFYLFVTMKGPERMRGTWILESDSPEGPFVPVTEQAATPARWECLDGTLYTDPENHPYLIFSHEWTQIHDGDICGLPLSDNLRTSVGRPFYLFSASEAPWCRSCSIFQDDKGHVFPNYITDGPFLHHTPSGKLLMLWSSHSKNGYTVGVAESGNGRIDGEWTHRPVPLFDADGGHPMLFRDFAGTLRMALHTPNNHGRFRCDERAVFPIVDEELTKYSL